MGPNTDQCEVCQGLSSQFNVAFLPLFVSNQLFGGCVMAHASVKVFRKLEEFG